MALEVLYDQASLIPENVEMTDLLGSEDQVLSASFLGCSGKVGIGSVRIDDPQSDSTSPEADLSVTLPSDVTPDVDYYYGNDFSLRVYVDLDSEFSFDVTEDTKAPIIREYLDVEMNGLDHLILGQSNTISIDFSWGSEGVPSDLAEIELEIWHGIDYNPHYAYSMGFKLTDATPQPGEFSINESEGQYTLIVNVPSSILQLEYERYAFRMNADGVWSSINKPNRVLSAH